MILSIATAAIPMMIAAGMAAYGVMSLERQVQRIPTHRTPRMAEISALRAGINRDFAATRAALEVMEKRA